MKQREIKFRAWIKDKELGDYMAHFDLTEDNRWIVEKGVELMQFTGLKDKNGKEIYEGDVVKFHGSHSRVGYPDWQINQVKWESDIVGFSPFAWIDADCDDHVGAVICEVIGNVYENPEVLEKI